MTTSRSTAGTVDGRSIERVRLEADGIAVDLLTLGACVQRVIVSGRDVVLAHPHAEDYAASPFYLGQTIGRFANRIGRARVTVDGIDYELLANEGSNLLHGGPDGFGHRLWHIDELTDDHVTMSLVSPDGDQGFPGDVRVQVRYTIAPGELRIDYTAESSAPTPVNLTNHIYFNPAGESSGAADALLLSISASRLVETDDELIPTGRLVEVGTSDLRQPRRIDDVAPLDTCFVIDAATGPIVHHATLAADDLAIDVLSDQPGIQVYTSEAMDTVPGLTGPYGRRAGIALETQNLPDAPNHADFPDAILRPGRPLHTTTLWRFRAI